MADVIDGWDIQKEVPADKRQKMPNQAARLSLVYPFRSLVVFQEDTKESFRYIGNDTLDPIPNTINDWEKVSFIHFTSGVPSNSLGYDGEYAINEAGSLLYKKTAGVWGAIISFQGNDILYGSGAPSIGLGSVGFLYIDQVTGDLYKKTGVSTWSIILTIKGTNGVSERYQTVSTDSINLTSLGTSTTINIETGLNYTPGQKVVVANSGTNFFTGIVNTYDDTTGAMNIVSIVKTGTATLDDWQVNLDGASGRQGKAFIHTEANITLTIAKINSIEAGVWTPTNPWSASILNDSRVGTELTARAGINGNMSGNSIAFDGVNWYNNGTWRGSQGLPGPPGDSVTGPPGPPGPVGTLPIEVINVNQPNFNLNLTEKKHYIIKVLNTSSVINLNGFSQVGTMVTFHKGTTISLSLQISSGVGVWLDGLQRTAGQPYGFSSQTYKKTFLVSAVNSLQEI